MFKHIWAWSKISRCTELQPFLSLAAFASLAKGGSAPGDLAAAWVLGVRAQGGHGELRGEAFFASICQDRNLKWSMLSRRWVKWAGLDLERLLQMLHLSPVHSPMPSRWLSYWLCTRLSQWRDLVCCSHHTGIWECLHLTDDGSSRWLEMQGSWFHSGILCLVNSFASIIFLFPALGRHEIRWEETRQRTETQREEFSPTRQQKATRRVTSDRSM